MWTPSDLLLKSRVSMWKLCWLHSGALLRVFGLKQGVFGSWCLRWGWKGVGQVGPWPFPLLGKLAFLCLPRPSYREPEGSWNWFVTGKIFLSLLSILMAAVLQAPLSVMSQRGKPQFQPPLSGMRNEFPGSFLWVLQRAGCQEWTLSSQHLRNQCLGSAL